MKVLQPWDGIAVLLHLDSAQRCAFKAYPLKPNLNCAPHWQVERSSGWIDWVRHFAAETSAAVPKEGRLGKLVSRCAGVLGRRSLVKVGL